MSRSSSRRRWLALVLVLLAALVATVLVGAGLLPNPLTLLIGDSTPPT